MKKYSLYLFLVLLVTVVSCSKESKQSTALQSPTITEDCTDKVDDFEKKTADQLINLEDNQDGGCSL